MIRRFNTEGRSALTDTTASRRWRGWTTWTGCLGWVRDMRYFVLHAPRQTGKTSALLALRDVLNAGAAGELHCMYVNVEPAQAVREDVHSAMQVIVGEVASPVLPATDSCTKRGRRSSPRSAPVRSRRSCPAWAEESKPLVVLIDEIDTLIGDALVFVLRQLRAGYNQRPGALPAECWCCAGFATRATTVSGRALERSSPGGARSTSERSRCVSATFRRRRRGLLLAQHTEEAGQAFMSEAIATVWRQTQGQPWLVNALSERACFRGEASRACTRPITEPAILDAQEQLILAQRRKLKTRRNHSAGAMCGVFRSDCETARPCAVASRDSHREVAERWMNSMPWQGA